MIGDGFGGGCMGSGGITGRGSFGSGYGGGNPARKRQPQPGPRRTSLDEATVKRLLTKLEKIAAEENSNQAGKFTISTTMCVGNREYELRVSKDGTFKATSDDGIEITLQYDRSVWGNPLTLSYENSKKPEKSGILRSSLTDRAQKLGRAWYAEANGEDGDLEL